MYKNALSFALLLAIASPIFAQAPAVKDPKKDDSELRKEAVAFLRETMGDVANMRTLENRISFSAELASLMWFHDEREAKSMFNTAIADFRELIAQLDTRMNMLPAEDDDVSGMPMRMFGDASDRAKLEMKYRVAMAVRQQITTSIAEHDPDVALSFFYDTASSNPRAQAMGGRDTHFEINLLKEIAMKSPSKASQYGVKSLASGLEYQHIELLKKIAEKDHAVAVEFGSAMLKKAKDTKFKSHELYALGSLLEFASDNLDSSRMPDGKKAIYSQADLRELSETIAKYILESESEGFGLHYLDTLEKYVPSRVAQIRAKLQPSFPNSNTNASYRSSANAAANYANSMANAYDAPPNASNSNADPRREAEEKLMGDVAKIGSGELPKEEREKVVAQARKILMQNRGKDQQITGLSMLAAQVAKAGDKELATQIMRDAESLVNPQPKNYQDFLYTWMLVSGYAESDPDKAFPILEGAIGRANDLIHAFIKVGEFIDVTEQMISDGEAQVGAFGGGMIRGLSKELGIAEATLGTLIKADFGKTKALTNRFDRTEVRVLAKLLVLRSVLGKNAPLPSAEEQVEKAMGQN